MTKEVEFDEVTAAKLTNPIGYRVAKRHISNPNWKSVYPGTMSIKNEETGRYKELIAPKVFVCLFGAISHGLASIVVLQKGYNTAHAIGQCPCVFCKHNTINLKKQCFSKV